MLHNDYFKGHLACRQSLLEVVNTVVYFGKKGEKLMHCNIKILPIYKLLKIYKTHTESHSCYKNNINIETQNPEAPTIILRIPI